MGISRLEPLSLQLDRSSPVPLYHQVSEAIEARVASGDLPTGTRLENETDLAKRLGLSRPTLRRAMQELVDKGLIVRKRGIGTQVVGVKAYKRQLRLTSLYDDLAQEGQHPTTDLLVHQVVAADPYTAEQLDLAEGSPVLHLERVRYADDEPLAILRNWLPADIGEVVVESEVKVSGLYEIFRRSGINLHVASQRIGASRSNQSEARLLGLDSSVPLVTLERVTFDDSGRQIEFGRHSYRGDRYCFEATLLGS